MIKNIIWDWSGTLNDDFGVVYKANKKVLAELGSKMALTKTQFKNEVQLPYMKFYSKFLPYVPRKKIEEAFWKFFSIEKSNGLFPGLKQVLNLFRQNGIIMAVLSSTPKRKAYLEMKMYAICGYFTAIKAGIHDKSTEVIRLIKSQHFKPTETVFVGDMVHDIETGKRAGITTIAVTWGYDDREKLADAKPDFLVGNISELKKVIKSL